MTLNRTTPLVRNTPLARTPFAPGAWADLAPGRTELRRTPWARAVPGITTSPGPLVKNAATRAPIRPVSARRQRENRARKAMAVRRFAGQPRCAVPWCTEMADDLHEPLTRARGGSITDEDNTVPVCRGHNEELTLEPKWGYDLGLLRHSWSPDGEQPAGAMSREVAALLFARDPWCVHCGWPGGLRPHLRQEFGEHAGCVCGWLLLCAVCRDPASYGQHGEAYDEGLVIAGVTVAPFTVGVLVHLEDDRGGMLKYPSCDGRWVDAPGLVTM